MRYEYQYQLKYIENKENENLLLIWDTCSTEDVKVKTPMTKLNKMKRYLMNERNSYLNAKLVSLDSTYYN